jgi:CRP/FNR family transcriptional regulator, cyclic AMP receptor protein
MLTRNGTCSEPQLPLEPIEATRCDESLQVLSSRNGWPWPDFNGQSDSDPTMSAAGVDASLWSDSPSSKVGHWQDSTVDPLYLFTLGTHWHQERDTGAGWELIRLLRSSDRDARTLAAELLAKTEHGRVLGRDLRRAKAKLNRPAAARAAEEEQGREKVTGMNTPYGLEIVENCRTCKLRKSQWFCGLSTEGVKLLGDARHLTTYPGGALLFVEGQAPRGVYVLCSGRAKLSTASREGKVLILKIAEAGEVLGLSAVISGQPFELTAETTGPCQVNFIEREALLQLIQKSGELGLHSSLALSREFQSAYRDIHDLVLARSSAGKLARLMLSWIPGREKSGGPLEVRVHPSLTHEEMAQMIGSSRETVTRLIGDLKKKKELIRLEGSTLVIQNRTALEALAN